MMREMTLARYAQLTLLLLAVAITAVNPGLHQTVIVLGVLTGMLAGSEITSGGLGGTILGTVLGAAFGLYLIGNM